MKKTGLLFTFLFSLVIPGQADTLTLSQCYREAQKNDPVNDEKSSQEAIYALKKRNLFFKWLPELWLNAQMMYASDVADFGDISSAIPIPGLSFPQMPHDQYKATLDIQQTLFDGLATSRSKQVEQATLEQQAQTTAVEQYKMVETINKLYFSLLLLERNLSLAELYKSELESRLTDLNAGVANGIILEENRKILKAEQIKAEQQIATLTIRHNTALSLLSFYTGLTFSDSPTLQVPQILLPRDTAIIRPEKKQFALQKNVMKANEKLISSALLPKAFGFLTFGYGNPPGNDIMNDAFDTYYTVGMGIKWNLFNWNTTRRNKSILEQQIRQLSIKEEVFDRSITAALKQQYAEIEQVEKTLESDRDLIAVREDITKTMSIKLKNGTVNSTEYITELNAEKQARINLEVHTLQLIQAKIVYMTISGQILSQYINQRS